MRNRVLAIEVDRAFGLVGLFLMLLVAKLAERGYARQRATTDRLAGFLARRAIDGIAVIGWLVDHIPRQRRSIALKAAHA